MGQNHIRAVVPYTQQLTGLCTDAQLHENYQNHMLLP